jgi:hypothetical protein
MSLEHDIAMCGAKMCYGSKISKGGFIKTTIYLMESMGGVTRSDVLGWAKGARGFTMTFKRAQGGSKIPPM